MYIFLTLFDQSCFPSHLHLKIIADQIFHQDPLLTHLHLSKVIYNLVLCCNVILEFVGHAMTWTSNHVNILCEISLRTWSPLEKLKFHKH